MTSDRLRKTEDWNGNSLGCEAGEWSVWVCPGAKLETLSEQELFQFEQAGFYFFAA